MSGRAVDRIGSQDLVQLATDVGPVAMNVGAVLLLDADRFNVEQARATLADRVRGIARLRQRLMSVPWGLGAPVWVDDATFDIAAHLTVMSCPPPGDRDALLEFAMGEVTRPLPRRSPLWRAALVTGVAGGRAALVVVLHHVLADGVGGLAILTSLADATTSDPDLPVAEAATAGPAPAVSAISSGPATVRGPTAATRAAATVEPRPPPTMRDLAVDNATRRLRSLRMVPRSLSRLRHGGTELGVGRRDLAPRCSLNSPTGERRRVRTVSVDLAAVRAGARDHGVTVNDVLLAAVTGAMRDLLRARGEDVPELVVSVPISGRTSTTVAELGNRVGVMPVRVPLDGPVAVRLAQVGRITDSQKTQQPGASASFVGPAFRVLAALGMFRWLIDRQRLVNTFVTNMRGPAQRLTLDGNPILEIIPVTITAGNVSVAFAAISYAGTLTVSTIVDPDLVPDEDRLRTALAAGLHDATS